MAKTPKVDINNDILLWCRESLGLSLVEAAKKIGIKSEKLDSWEQGEDKPSFAQLKKVASTYKRPSAIFFMENRPQDPALPQDFRVLNETEVSSLSADSRVEIRKAQRKRRIAIEILKELGEEAPRFTEKAILESDIKKLATKYRNKFSLSFERQKEFSNEYTAFNFWKSSIESLGVLVFQASLDSLDELRGLALFHQNFPLILLNTKDSPRGKTFSLLHEFCHLLLHKSGIGNMNPSEENRNNPINRVEVFCNAFAAECMVPSSYFIQILNENPNLSLDRTVTKLSRIFEASYEVILRRLLDHNKISRQQYREKRAEYKEFFSKKETKKKKVIVPHDIKVFGYNGEPFTKLVLEGFDNQKITSSDVSNYLGVKLSHVEKMRESLKKRGA